MLNTAFTIYTQQWRAQKKKEVNQNNKKIENQSHNTNYYVSYH